MSNPDAIHIARRIRTTVMDGEVRTYALAFDQVETIVGTSHRPTSWSVSVSRNGILINTPWQLDAEEITNLQAAIRIAERDLKNFRK